MSIRAAQKDQVRSALIDNGMRLYTTQGFPRTTVDQITSAAGVAKGTFYNYFTTKEDLLVAGMIAAQAEEAERVQANILLLPTTWERLIRLIEWSVTWIEVHAELSLIWCLERLRRGQVEEKPSGFDGQMLQIIVAGQEAGELRRDRAPEALALEATALFVFAIICWVHAGQKYDLAASIEQSLHTYLTGAKQPYP